MSGVRDVDDTPAAIELREVESMLTKFFTHHRNSGLPYVDRWPMIAERGAGCGRRPSGTDGGGCG